MPHSTRNYRQVSSLETNRSRTGPNLENTVERAEFRNLIQSIWKWSWPSCKRMCCHGEKTLFTFTNTSNSSAYERSVTDLPFAMYRIQLTHCEERWLFSLMYVCGSMFRQPTPDEAETLWNLIMLLQTTYCSSNCCIVLAPLQSVCHHPIVYFCFPFLMLPVSRAPFTHMIISQSAQSIQNFFQ